MILLHHHKVYALASVFILSFYELINLIRIIVSYSITLAQWDKGFSNIMSTDFDLSTIKALTITCLICACLGLMLNILSYDHNLRRVPITVTPHTTTTATNAVRRIYQSNCTHFYILKTCPTLGCLFHIT